METVHPMECTEPRNLWVVGEDTVEVRELMGSRHIEDHRLAIDALTGWLKARELSTPAPEGKDFYDVHHFYNRKAGKGQPFNQWRQRPENKVRVRRDCHEALERLMGWLRKPYIEDVKLYMEEAA